MTRIVTVTEHVLSFFERVRSIDCRHVFWSNVFLFATILKESNLLKNCHRKATEACLAHPSYIKNDHCTGACLARLHYCIFCTDFFGPDIGI